MHDRDRLSPALSFLSLYLKFSIIVSCFIINIYTIIVLLSWGKKTFDAWEWGIGNGQEFRSDEDFADVIEFKKTAY